MGVTIPSAAGEVLEQYEVSNSLRFNSADSAYLHITPSASNRDLFTINNKKNGKKFLPKFKVGKGL